ncbi:hypothetical protein FRB94_009721 [Tulasnella sp. JGI-2019a]|nr:hypothetical protein FRB93_001136 [Tulasnella sp. JGI-2019a]KAG9010814.1 hypothetical protein FRB94_009721 [Tulasnella sp. JGI-2019a]KAG9035677.1 hypothetical protein FRB95_010915 [Tulasnella sp. JGI-2019a]
MEYQPAATIHPGNISYREPSPPGSDEVPDDSSDNELNDVEYAMKINNEIGLGQVTEAEAFASLPVLLPRPKSAKEAKEIQNRIHSQLQYRLNSLTRGDRFRATNLYAPPGSSATPQFGTSEPFIGTSTLPQPSPPNPTGRSAAASMPTSGAAWPVGVTRQYALPAEPPVASVPTRATNMDGAEMVDRLLLGAIDDLRAKAESARDGLLGGLLGSSDTSGNRQ